MKRLFALLAALAVLMASASALRTQAQFGEYGQFAPGGQDIHFVTDAAENILAEVALGKLGVSKGIIQGNLCDQ